MKKDNSFGVGIIGTGKYLPSKLLKNSTIEKSTGIAPGTISKKTGIRSRYVVSDGETASNMASNAAKGALNNAGIKPNDIGLIICSTFSGDYRYPALACKVQKDLNAKKAAAFDVMANCTGFQVALSVASDKMMINPEIKYSLVVGSALQSRFINWEDPNSAIYFGDGAGAAVLAKVPSGYGLLATDIFSDTSAYESVRMRGGGSSFPANKRNEDPKIDYYEINGLEVWKQLMRNQPTSIKNVLGKVNFQPKDVDLFLFHQANLLLIQYLMAKMKISKDKTFTNVQTYGNTADASIGIVLHDSLDKKIINRDDIVLLSGVGAGFTFGSSILRWY